MTQNEKITSAIDTKIAVIIPVRNEEKFIGKTLTGLFNQDLQPYRIIVINDSSTDKTLEILEKFKVEVIEDIVFL